LAQVAGLGEAGRDRGLGTCRAGKHDASKSSGTGLRLRCGRKVRPLSDAAGCDWARLPSSPRGSSQDIHAAGLAMSDDLDFMRPARFSSNAGFPMLRFRFYVCVQLVVLASLAIPVSHAFAQRVDMSIGDEPGVIPNAADEQLPPQFRRQVVLYRS